MKQSRCREHDSGTVINKILRNELMSGPHITVLSASDPAESAQWEALVDSAPVPDVYYRPGYVLAYEKAWHGIAKALVLETGQTRLLIPLLIRTLSGMNKTDEPLSLDAYSPYGYGGVLLLSQGPVPPEEDVIDAVRLLRDWCAGNHIICCLLRLHPVLRQDAWLFVPALQSAWVRLYRRGSTRGVDLTQWNDRAQCIAGTRKGRRSDLQAARRLARVTWSDPGCCGETELRKDFAVFRRMYDDTMCRLQAAPFYFFPEDYYRALSGALPRQVGLALAWIGDQAVGGAIFFADRHYAHYHLSAATEAGLRAKVPTLLVNAGAEWARMRGCSLMHLGGGLSEGDNLARFKESFGGHRYHYSSITVIADLARYRDLQEAPDAPWPYSADAENAATAVEVPLAPGSATHATAGNRVVGIGAGGHAKVILDILKRTQEFQVVGLIESHDVLASHRVSDVPVLGDESLLPNLFASGVHSAFLGIGGVGNNQPRSDAFHRLAALGFRLINAIHPTAIVAPDVTMGQGVTICAVAIVNPGAHLGDNVILNTGCIVEHDCVIGDHVHIAPGAVLSGEVKVGDHSHIGTGATVRQGIVIGKHVIVGAGAVVVGDVPDGITVVGVPARTVVYQAAR